MHRLKKLLTTPLGRLSPKKALLLIAAVLAFGFSLLIYTSLGELNDLNLRRVTGIPGGRDYLLIFQNDAERRPTGGFISSYAILRFRFGVPLIDFGNVYDTKLIQPGTELPDPTAFALIDGPLYPGHGLRDGNFDPDFPTSARELIRLYQLGYPEQTFDGVIAVDFTAFEHLLAAVGGVEIDGQKFNSGNLFHAVESAVQDVDTHDPEQLANRKNILSQLAKALIRKIVFSPLDLRAVSESLIASLNSKNLLLYFTDFELQGTVKAKNWAGELPFSADSDLLAIVEGNYGGMKSSRYLTRDIFYDVILRQTQDDDLKTGLQAVANLKIQLAHRGDAAEPISGYYKGYFRIFAPLGSQLISGQVDRAYEDGRRQVFEKVVQMNPGETREIDLRYTLPDFVLDDGYSLELIKQAGSAPERIRISVKAPAGYLFSTVDSRQNIRDSSFNLRENLAIFTGSLEQDRDLNLQIIPDTAPPGLAWQEFRGGLKQIDLRFNEPLDPASVENAIYELRDLNYRNDRTDEISVSSVRFVSPQNILLNVAGITEECREWYELTLGGVADQHGNALTDKKITVVQWLNAAGEPCDPERAL
jgi:hypothetical protein